MRIYLQTHLADRTPPKFCHLILQKDLLDGWTFIRETGTQGRAGRVKKDHFTDLDAAESALATSRDQHIQKGFQVMITEGAHYD